LLLFAATAANARGPVIFNTISTRALEGAIPGYGEPVFGPVKITVETTESPSTGAEYSSDTTTKTTRLYTRDGKLSQFRVDTLSTYKGQTSKNFEQTDYNWRGNLLVAERQQGIDRSDRDGKRTFSERITYTYDTNGCLVRWERQPREYLETYSCKKTGGGYTRTGKDLTQTFDSRGWLISKSSTQLGIGMGGSGMTKFDTRYEYEPAGDNLVVSHRRIYGKTHSCSVEW